MRKTGGAPSLRERRTYFFSGVRGKPACCTRAARTAACQGTLHRPQPVWDKRFIQRRQGHASFSKLRSFPASWLRRCGTQRMPPGCQITIRTSGLLQHSSFWPRLFCCTTPGRTAGRYVNRSVDGLVHGLHPPLVSVLRAWEVMNSPDPFAASTTAAKALNAVSSRHLWPLQHGLLPWHTHAPGRQASPAVLCRAAGHVLGASSGRVRGARRDRVAERSGAPRARPHGHRQHSPSLRGEKVVRPAFQRLSQLEEDQQQLQEELRRHHDSSSSTENEHTDEHANGELERRPASRAVLATRPSVRSGWRRRPRCSTRSRRCESSSSNGSSSANWAPAHSRAPS